MHLIPSNYVQIISTLTAYHEPGGGRHDRNAIVYLIHTQPERYLARVHFESKFCMACFWEGQDPESSFITHFLKVTEVQERVEPYFAREELCVVGSGSKW